MPGSIPKTAAASPMMGCQDEKAIKKIKTYKESITTFLNACFLQASSHYLQTGKKPIKDYLDANAFAPFLGA